MEKEFDVAMLKHFDEGSFTKLVEETVASLWKSDSAFLLSGGVEFFRERFGSIALMRMVHKERVAQVLLRLGFFAALAKSLPDMFLDLAVAIEGAKLLVAYSDMDSSSVASFCLRVSSSDTAVFDRSLLKGLSNSKVAALFVEGKGPAVLFSLLESLDQKTHFAVDAINRLESNGLEVFQDGHQMELFSVAAAALVKAAPSDVMTCEVVLTLVQVAKQSPQLLPDAVVIIAAVLALLKSGILDDTSLSERSFFLLEKLKAADCTLVVDAPDKWKSILRIKELRRAELIATEERFMRQLEELVQHFMEPLKAVLDIETINRLFGNLKNVLEVTRDLNHRLKGNASPTAFVDEFSKIATRYEQVLEQYWSCYHFSDTTRLALLRRNKAFKSKYMEIIANLPESTVALFGGHRDLLGDSANFLSLPTKRPGHVVLFCAELSKCSAAEDPDRAKWSSLGASVHELIERIQLKCPRVGQKTLLRNFFRAGNESGGDFSQAGEFEYTQALVARDRANNFLLARALFESASNKGHAEAQFELGRFYKLGLGEIAIDLEKARALFEAAARTLPDAGLEAGLLYSQMGDLDFALDLLNEAWEGGQVEAGFAATQVLLALDPPREDEALRMLTEVSMRGSVKAREALIKHYRKIGRLDKVVTCLAQYCIVFPGDRLAKLQLKAALAL